MMNLNNPNYLLIDEVFPDDYLDINLRIVAQNVMIEFDNLRGENKYQEWIRNTGQKQNEENKIIIMHGILQLFDTEPDRAMNVIKECGLKYRNKAAVEKALKFRMFDLKVERLKEEAENKINEDNKTVWTFEDACIPIESFYKVQLDYDMTAAKYCAWEKRLKEDIKKKSA